MTSNTEKHTNTLLLLFITIIILLSSVTKISTKITYHLTHAQLLAYSD